MAQPCLMDLYAVICWCGKPPRSRGRVPEALLPHCHRLFGVDGATYTGRRTLNGFAMPSFMHAAGAGALSQACRRAQQLC